MEMRRLEPINQLIERLAALEDSVRTGKPAATSGARTSAPPRGAKAPTAPWSPAATSPASPAPAASDAVAEVSPGKSKSAVSSGTASAGSYSAAATKTALEAVSRISIDVAGEPPAMSAAYAEPGQVADDSEVGQIKAALEKKRKMFLVTALEGARRASLEGDELCLEFAPNTKHLRDTLAKSENIKILREVCRETTGRDLGVRFVISDGERAGAPVTREETERREKQTLREQAEKDPKVQQMLRTFRAKWLM